MEKYEEKLWGKIEFLHDKTLLDQNKLNIFFEIVIKYHTALSNFLKSIESIKTLNTEIISENKNSLNSAIKGLQKALIAHINEIKECISHIQISIIDLIIKAKEDKFVKEKEMYNQYNKLKYTYNTMKSNCDKAKDDYFFNVKLTENNIHNLIQYKANKLNIFNELNEKDEEIAKTEEKMNLAISNTKILEEKYIQIIDDTNNTRIKMIKKEEELLQLYQKINYDFYNKINCIIIFLIPVLRKMFSSILSDLNGTEERCKKMNIKQDINDFIKNNTSNISQEKPIIFEPYLPEANLQTNNISGNDKKELENLDINYNILKILKQNFKNIRNDINMEEEQKKFRLRFLCNQIFKIGPGVGFSLQEKEELIDLIKEPNYKSFFLIILSKQRTKGRFKRSEKLVKELVEILINILDSSEKLNDFESAKNCIILSETFYYEKEKNKKDEKNKNKNKKEGKEGKDNNIESNKKIYLIDYIKYYKWFQNIDFWEGIIEHMIQNEIIKSEKINEKNKTNETPEEIKNKISNIGFSIVLSYTNTMSEFNISKENINKIVDIFVKKYNIEETIALAIYENVKSSPVHQTDEENKKLFEKMIQIFEENKNKEKNIKIKNDDENNLDKNEIKVDEKNIKENKENIIEKNYVSKDSSKKDEETKDSDSEKTKNDKIENDSEEDKKIKDNCEEKEDNK